MEEIKLRAWHDGKMWQVSSYSIGGLVTLVGDGTLRLGLPVMLYTGYKDQKGIRGKEIYVADIIRINLSAPHIVEFGTYSAYDSVTEEWTEATGFYLVDPEDTRYPNHFEKLPNEDGSIYEVLGNIYKNHAWVAKLYKEGRRLAKARAKSYDELYEELPR